MDRLEQGVAFPQVCSRHQAEAANQTGAHVAQHVAEEVFHHQDIVARRVERQFQAQAIDVNLLELQKGVIVGHRPRRRQEQTVAQRQHVVLVTEGDPAPALRPCQLEGVADDALRRHLGNDAQTLHHAGNDDVFQAGVQPLRVLADDNEIDAVVGHLDAWQGRHGPHAGEQVKFFAEANVDRAKALADGRRAGAFQSDAVLADEVEGGLG